MTASKRYVPVSLVCLLIASTSAAMAGPSSMLDPYAQIQAPTAKEIEEKTNKARAKKGLPPIHAKQSSSSTVVEDATLSPTTYVTAPGGGNGKVVKGTSIAESKGETAPKSGKLFGLGIPSIPIPGFGKKSEKSEPEVKVAKAPKAPKAPKVKSVKPAAKEIAPQEIAQKEAPEADLASETPVAKAAPAVETVKTATASSDDGIYTKTTKTIKGATSGMVNGSKKVGSGIASGAKASGNFFAKGASMVGNGFKATGEKIKDGSGSMGKMARMPNLFKKGDSKVANNNGLPHAFSKQNQENAAKAKLAAKAPAPSAAKQPDALATENKAAIAQPDDLIQETNPLPKTAAANAPLGVNDELVPDSKRGKKGGLALPKFNLNPFAKKVAGKDKPTI